MPEPSVPTPAPTPSGTTPSGPGRSIQPPYVALLRDCPSAPNCVSTHATASRRRAEPIPFTGPLAEVQQRLRRVLERMPRVEVVFEEPNYLRAEARTRLGFVDDVELALEESEPGIGRIHYRSASRTGWWDLGVNRRRMEAVRRAFLATGD